MANLLPTFRGRGGLAPSLVLLVGWALSGGIFAQLQNNLRNADEATFAALTKNATDDIEGRLNTYVAALRGGAGLVLASPSVGRDEWTAFAETMDLPGNYPGINGIGLVSRVPFPATENFLQRTRGDGQPDFTIRPFPGATPTAGIDRYVITYVEPEASNRAALGLDLATETARRAGAEAARDSGDPQITSRISLVQDGAHRPGFLLYVPVYRRGAPVSTVEERRAALRAWVYAPFVTENFLAGVLGRRTGILQLHLFEQKTTDRAHLVYTSEQLGPTLPTFKRVRSLQLAGQTFTLGWNRGPNFPPSDQSMSVVIASSLALGTLLLAAQVRSLQSFRQRAEELTAERTRELQEQIAHRESLDRTLEEVSAFQLSLLESASTAIIATDPNGVIRTFNAAAQRLLGYTEHELVGRQTPGIFHDPAEVAARAAQFSRELGCTVEPGFDVLVIKACRDLPNEHEWTYVRKDGGRITVLLAVAAIRDAAGNFTGFMGTATDITARKQAEASLQQEQNLLHTLVENLPAAIFVKDVAGRYLLSNKAHAESLGLSSAASIIGKTMHSFFPQDATGVFSATDTAVLSAGRSSFEVEERFERDGQAGYFSVTKLPLRDAQNRVIAIVGIKHDITARKAHEAALVAAGQAAEASSKAKSEFLAVMSHEIRTPMNAVIGFTELLLETPLQEQQRDFVEIIRSSGRSLLSLINDILDFSKIEAGKLEVEHVRLDGVRAVESVAKTLSLQAKAKGLALRVSVAPNVPRVLVADPSRLRQVLINLVGNALKFTAQGRVTLSVAAAGPASLRLGVTDTGIGIPPDQQAALFQKFAQADATITRKFGGTGLGLAICKRLVELMGGTIGLTSAAGEGSTFWCELPLSPDQTPLDATGPDAAPVASPPPALAAVAADRTPPPPTGKRRVLVVDDQRLNQRLVQIFLNKLDCESFFANNGAEAVSQVQAAPFDLVLMDHQMPVMDGLDATKAIRLWEQEQRRAVHLPILALTANASEGGEAFYLAAGMDGYLTKPLLRPALERAMAAVMAPRAAAVPVLPPRLDRPSPWPH